MSATALRFRAERAALAAAIADAGRALPARPVSAVLNTLRLTASDGEVEVVGYDYDVCIRATVPAVVEEPGVALAPGRALAASLAALPHGDIAVEQIDSRLQLWMPRVRYGLTTLPSEDYPALPTLPAAIGTFDAETLARAVAKAAVAARPVAGLDFSGAVHLDAGPEQLVIAATDRYTIATAAVAWQVGGPAEPVEALVSARALTDALKGMTGEVSLCVDDTGIAVVGAERALMSRRLDVEFPLLRTFVERMPPPATRVRLHADQFAAAMSAAARVVAANRTPVRLTVSPDDGLAYAAADEGQSDLTGEAVVLDVSGDAVTVGVNPLYLSDALKVLGSVEVELHIRGDRKALSVVDPSCPDDIYVIQPIKLP